MSNVVSAKRAKIKPENMAQAEGVVTRVKYAGSSSVGFGPISNTTHLWKVFVQITGVEKPLVMKVKERAGWNADIIQSVGTISRMLGGGQKPINEGEKLAVVYDRTKPKKCFTQEQ